MNFELSTSPCYFFPFQFLVQFDVLVDELLEVDILVADTPPLEDDDANQRQHYHNHCGSESNGDDEIHVHLQFDDLRFTAAKVRQGGKTTVPHTQFFVPMPQKCILGCATA